HRLALPHSCSGSLKSSPTLWETKSGVPLNRYWRGSSVSKSSKKFSSSKRKTMSCERKRNSWSVASFLSISPNNLRRSPNATRSLTCPRRVQRREGRVMQLDFDTPLTVGEILVRIERDGDCAADAAARLIALAAVLVRESRS